MLPAHRHLPGFPSSVLRPSLQSCSSFFRSYVNFGSLNLQMSLGRSTDLLAEVHPAHLRQGPHLSFNWCQAYLSPSLSALTDLRHWKHLSLCRTSSSYRTVCIRTFSHLQSHSPCFRSSSSFGKNCSLGLFLISSPISSRRPAHHLVMKVCSTPYCCIHVLTILESTPASIHSPNFARDLSP